MLTFLVVAVFVAAWAALTDVRTGLIPNWLTAFGMVFGVGGHFLAGTMALSWQAGLTQSATAIGGLLFCGAAPFLLFWRGAMGGGDVKLFAAIGALCQPLLGIEAQMYALLFAAIFAPMRLAMQGRLLRVLSGSLALLVRPFRESSSSQGAPPEGADWFRLGPCILAGAAATLALHAHEFTNLSAQWIQP